LKNYYVRRLRSGLISQYNVEDCANHESISNLKLAGVGGRAAFHFGGVVVGFI
jgi:hypothetical protein